jgi:hypothetical protein
MHLICLSVSVSVKKCLTLIPRFDLFLPSERAINVTYPSGKSINHLGLVAGFNKDINLAQQIDNA